MKSENDKEKRQQAEEYFKLGNDYYRQDKYNNAIEAYRKAIELNPDYAEAYYNLGIVYGKQGDYVEAIKKFGKAIELKPGYAEAYDKLSIAYNYQGIVCSKRDEYVNAIEAYKEAIKLKPDYAEACDNLGIAYNNLGIIYYDQGEYAKAIEEFEKAKELKPKEAAVYYNLGNAYAKLDEYANAIEKYEKAIELNPDYAEAYNNRGNSYNHLGEYDKAIKSYNEAIKLNPDYAEVYNNNGIIYKKQGNYAEAIERYKKAIKLKRDFANGYNNLIELCENSNKYVDEVAVILDENKGYFKTTIAHIMSLCTNKNLIDTLLDKNYDEYFCWILKKYGETDNSSEAYHVYKQIYLSSVKIMQLLHVRNDEETTREFAHYTRKVTAEKLLIKETKDATVSRFRLSSTQTSNDAMEGKTAFKYLSLENKETIKDYQAFIACFAFDPECLNLFRLYGKQGQEATGVSLVFDKDFFAKEPVSIVSSSMAHEKIKNEINPDVFDVSSSMKSERIEDKIKQGDVDIVPYSMTNEKNEDETIQDKKYALYRCIYIDPETRQIISLGQKDDYTFYRDRLDETGKEELSDEDTKKISAQIVKYKEKINKNLKEVQDEFDNLKKLVQNNIINNNLGCALLINLRYLVKDIAFKEEQECRIVTAERIDDNDKVKRKGDSMFVETMAIDKIVKKVYFGSNVTDEDMELFQEKLVHTGSKIKCRKCTHPIR
jgi:tetratricopeptide (TPR) repeat protein